MSFDKLHNIILFAFDVLNLHMPSFLTYLALILRKIIPPCVLVLFKCDSLALRWYFRAHLHQYPNWQRGETERGHGMPQKKYICPVGSGICSCINIDRQMMRSNSFGWFNVRRIAKSTETQSTICYLMNCIALFCLHPKCLTCICTLSSPALKHWFCAK